MPTTKSQKTLSILILTCAWFAVIAQFILLMNARTASVPETIIRFFSFFTILTNIIVALCFESVLLNEHILFSENVSLRKKFRLHRLFKTAGSKTAVTVYIIVVGAVYNLVLRFLWKPEGLQKFVDELLHTVVPLLTLIYWIAYVPKTGFKWKDSLQWMIYPFCYIIFITVRGALSGYYPYPFINVTEIGYPRALLNGAGLVAVFMGLSLFLIAIAKFSSERYQKNY